MKLRVNKLNCSLSFVLMFFYISTSMFAQRVGNWRNCRSVEDFKTYFKNNIAYLDPVEGIETTSETTKAYNYDHQLMGSDNSENIIATIKDQDGRFLSYNITKQEMIKGYVIKKGHNKYGQIVQPLYEKEYYLSDDFSYSMNFVVKGEELRQLFVSQNQNPNLANQGYISFSAFSQRLYPTKEDYKNLFKKPDIPPTEYTLSRIVQTKSIQVLKPQQIYQKYNSAVFMIYTQGEGGISQGSGFFVSKDGIGISNYHVFQGTLKGKEIIKLITGEVCKITEILGFSEKYDYIIFKVNGNNLNYIPITKRGFSVADEVVAIGSPLGLENTFSRGDISQNRGNFKIQINAPIDHGSSGGALINKYGEVIGITSGGIDSSGANLNFAIDIRAIFEK